VAEFSQLRWIAAGRTAAGPARPVHANANSLKRRKIDGYKPRSEMATRMRTSSLEDWERSYALG